MENCCDSLFKTIILVFNLIFALVGLILMGFGVYVQIDAKDYLNFLGDNYTNTPVFIIILGAIIFVVAFFGCCGAMKENKCLMYTYGFLLFVILIAQVIKLFIVIQLSLIIPLQDWCRHCCFPYEGRPELRHRDQHEGRNEELRS